MTAGARIGALVLLAGLLGARAAGAAEPGAFPGRPYTGGSAIEASRVPEQTVSDGGTDCTAAVEDAEAWMQAGSPWSELGSYERHMVARALCERGDRPVMAAEGRPICGVSVHSFEVFVAGDPFPRWPNLLHANSTASVITRIAGVSAGDRWTERLRRDAERRLKDPFIYSLAVLVPVEPAGTEGPGDGGGCVEALFVTRDVWSLRPIVRPESSGSEITKLTLALVEQNLAGRNLQLGGLAVRDMGVWSAGPFVVVRRMPGTRFGGFAQARVFWERDGAGVDGSRVEGYLQAPISSLDEKNGWRFDLVHDDRTMRVFEGFDLARFDADATPADDALPESWRQREIAARAAWTRAVGRAVRHELSPYLYLRSVVTDYGAPAGADPAAVAELERELLPVRETVAGPGLRWRFFTPRYRSIENVRSFGVAEELASGWSGVGDLLLTEPSVGSDRRSLSSLWELALEGPLLGNDQARAMLQAEAGTDGERGEDLLAGGELRWSTPYVLAGRVHMRAGLRQRWRNRANRVEVAGGDAGLRGWVPGALRGDSMTRANLEWRSRPLVWFETRWGLAAFADAARAWGDETTADLLGSVGAGFRVMIPQFQAGCWSFDLAMPTRVTDGRVAWSSTPLFHLRFDQAF